MKLLTLSLAIAPLSLGALFSSEPASEVNYLEHALFGGFNPALYSDSAQCQGDCQEDEETNPASQNNGSHSRGILSELIRNFLQPKENYPAGSNEAIASDISDLNHIVVDSTPVFEMLYNYINSASKQIEVPVYPQSTAIVDAETAPEIESSGILNRLIDEFMDADRPDSIATSIAENWIMAAEKSPASLAASYAEDFFAPTSFVAQSEADSPSAENVFDFNSWKNRVDSAAHRLVTNVEGIIVHFLPTASPQTPSATAAGWYEDAMHFEDNFTAVTNMIQDSDEMVESESLTHWFDYI
ncbi:hypothetical protein H4R24_002928 [Coemansia sp. RSA 988]|nr:hypothetical protein H4R24_002928 [Coemansia sp. RSA 988]